MNGQILKYSFMTIVISLCIVLVGGTAGFLLGKVNMDSYKALLELLGIPTLIGVIVQSYLHMNQTNQGGNNEVISTTTVSSPIVPASPSTITVNNPGTDSGNKPTSPTA